MLDRRVEPFSFAALVKSKGKSSLKSEVTPKLFEDGDEVVLNALYPKLYNEFKNPTYKKYFSILEVYGASWNIDEQCWYYHVRYKRAAFLTVTEDKIKKAPAQTKIAEGPEGWRVGMPRRQRSTWNREQQSLDPNPDIWKAGSADEELKQRLARRK